MRAEVKTAPVCAVDTVGRPAGVLECDRKPNSARMAKCGQTSSLGVKNLCDRISRLPG